MSGRIDHAAEARQHIEWAHERQSEEGITDRSVTDTALIAQAEATLALAEQQRIANVIALGQFRVMPSDLPWFRHLVIQPSGDVGIDLTDEVRTGLGL
ncbi:hypothetical protein [Microbacterium sp. UBA3394]|uniref:hypothetical protein n=1 Tax=Microbacterium sp. UBA3394 TaxID=1946945 RepID=UPI000C55453B|nr:hypothetical protein [Microbacterium sp. UBA3394]MAM53395.1 hypothetical protein [Microbacterium sp.]|tara:strand:- start:850 stop:1143 length:294 start_codon:yes stop_codon:yes gene_type:complete